MPSQLRAATCFAAAPRLPLLSSPSFAPSSLFLRPLDRHPSLHPPRPQHGLRAMKVTAAVTILCLLAASSAAAAPGPAAATAAAMAFPAGTAFAVPPGGSLTVSGYKLEGDTTLSTLTLERFEVWAPTAKVFVHRPNGTEELGPPATRYFKGAPLAGRCCSPLALHTAALK